MKEAEQMPDIEVSGLQVKPLQLPPAVTYLGAKANIESPKE